MANINHGLSSRDNLRRFAETIAIMKFSFKAKMLAAEGVTPTIRSTEEPIDRRV